MEFLSTIRRVALASLFFASTANLEASVITTTFASNNNNEGNMFNLTNISAVSVTLTGAFEGNFFTGQSGTAQIWYRAGSYVGYELDRSGWTLLGTGAYTSAGHDVPTAYDVGASLLLNPGDILGILFITSASNQIVNYTNGSGNFSDAFLQISAGIGLDFDDAGLLAGQPPINTSSFNANRIWNGSIEYTAVPEPSTLGLSGIALACTLAYRRRRSHM